MLSRSLHCFNSINVFVVLCIFAPVFSQVGLVINVKNQGGDVLQETIIANETEDTVTLEFQRPDGTLITQFIHFPDEIQIMRTLVLGEEERGQSQYQVMCFVFRYQKGEFIPSDAMAKLRQKNPGTIRTPEEESPRQNYTMDLYVELEKSSIISTHIRDLCAEAENSTYAREVDIKYWESQRAYRPSVVPLSPSVKRFPPGRVPRCRDSTHSQYWRPCTCHLEMCVGWYPCGLKYCKNKDTGKMVSRRCGIKTCRKCRLFQYYVKQKQYCLWDEG